MDIIQKTLDLLLSNDTFAKQFTERIPQLESDVISFKLNPSCSCKSKIVRHLEQNVSDTEWAQIWIQTNILPSTLPIIEVKTGDNIVKTTMPQLPPEELKKLKLERQRMALKATLPQTEWKNFKDVIGEVVEIEPNPNKYKQLMTVAREKWFYNGLNVIETVKTDPKTGAESIVWLVLFY